MTLLNAIPRVVLAPLFVIWLGIELASKVALAFILVAVVIFFTVYGGIRQVDRKLVERIVTLGGTRWDLVRHVYLPSVAAWVLGNLKVAVGFAFTGACVGEFVGASRGLGYLLSFAQSTYNSALMFALIFLIMVVVLLIFAAAGQARKIPAALAIGNRHDRDLPRSVLQRDAAAHGRRAVRARLPAKPRGAARDRRRALHRRRGQHRRIQPRRGRRTDHRRRLSRLLLRDADRLLRIHRRDRAWLPVSPWRAS